MTTQTKLKIGTFVVNTIARLIWNQKGYDKNKFTPLKVPTKDNILKLIEKFISNQRIIK